MNLTFPEWIPLWVQFMLLILAAAFGMCFLFMPFAVFGLKGRLNYLNQQMEDMQAQLRILLKRTVDLQPRSESRIQAVGNQQAEVENSKDAKDVGKKTYEPEPYVYPLPTLKKQFVSDDFSGLNSSVTADVSSNELGLTAGKIENLSRNRVRPSQGIYVENGEDRLYDPPALQNEKSNVVNPKKRTEPILRWPPQ